MFNIYGEYSFIKLLSAHLLFPENDCHNTYANTNAFFWVRGMKGHMIEDYSYILA